MKKIIVFIFLIVAIKIGSSFAIELQYPENFEGITSKIYHDVSREQALRIRYKDKVIFEPINKEYGKYRIKGANETKITLEDNPKNDISHIKHEFLGYAKDIGFYVFRSYLYEGTNLYFINEKSGFKSSLGNDTSCSYFLSPKKDNIASICNADMGNHGIYIYKIDGDKIIQSFEWPSPYMSSYTFGNWQNNDNFTMSYKTPGNKQEFKEIKFVDSGWKIIDQLSPYNKK